MRIRLADMIEMITEERENLQEKINALNALLEAYGSASTSGDDERQARKKYAKHRKNSPGGKKGRRAMCRTCGDLGHTSKTCTNAKPTDDRTIGDLREEVYKLQRDGNTSIQIASKLKISLSQVNRYWDPDIAIDGANNDENDDG